LCITVVLLTVDAYGPLKTVGGDVGRVTVGNDILETLPGGGVTGGGGADVAIHFRTVSWKEVGAETLAVTGTVFKTSLGARSSCNGIAVLAVTSDAFNRGDARGGGVAVAYALALGTDDDLWLDLNIVAPGGAVVGIQVWAVLGGPATDGHEQQGG
jgi:hypothetical protein